MFGGLDICSLEAVVTKEGEEVIIEVNDCAVGMMGESQEEDRRHIAELVLERMEARCKPGLQLANGHGERGAELEKAVEKQAVKSEDNPLLEKKAKSLPGPVQKGRPERQRNASQGGLVESSGQGVSLTLSADSTGSTGD